MLVAALRGDTAAALAVRERQLARREQRKKALESYEQGTQASEVPVHAPPLHVAQQLAHEALAEQMLSHALTGSSTWMDAETHTHFFSNQPADTEDDDDAHLGQYALFSKIAVEDSLVGELEQREATLAKLRVENLERACQRDELLRRLEARQWDTRAQLGGPQPWRRRIVLLIGPPACGKRTLMPSIASALGGVPQLSVDALLCAAGLGVAPNAARDSAQMNLVRAEIERLLADASCAAGCVLSGFPQTVDQARLLDGVLAQTGDAVAMVIALDVADDGLCARAAARWIHRGSGRTYSTLHGLRPQSLSAALLARKCPESPMADATPTPNTPDPPANQLFYAITRLLSHAADGGPPAGADLSWMPQCLVRGRAPRPVSWPPPEFMLDDVSGEPLERQQEDSPPAFRARLQEYRRTTQPVLAHYVDILHNVNAHSAADQARLCIEALLSRGLPYPHP
jgi:adenylate kinase family enzyme